MRSGLAIFTQVKAGFVWSGRMGSGVVIARLPDGSWSAPSCIGTGGVGFGLQIGAVSDTSRNTRTISTSCSLADMEITAILTIHIGHVRIRSRLEQRRSSQGFLK